MQQKSPPFYGRGLIKSVKSEILLDVLAAVLDHDALVVVANLLACEVVGWGVDDDILGVHIIDAGTFNFFYEQYVAELFT